ncbi:MAG: hypothetical protein JSS50_01065 [Proteobacteria bacterium]|nr:hypothetical protein [Pseudomonadota bacterium]
MSSSDKNQKTYKVVVVPGQGIGPECMAVAKAVVQSTGAPIEFIEGPDIQLGYPDAPELLAFLGYSKQDAQDRVAKILAAHGYKDYYKALIASLTPDEKSKLEKEVARKERITLEQAASASAVLKGALRTMDTGDEPSRNVTLRKMFEEYANFRRCVSLDPVIPAIHGGVDILFVRENVEDLYAQIEQRLTRNYAQAQRHNSVEGCEKIIVAAFEAALREGRKKVSGLEKPNILKITGGMFKQVFNQVAARYKSLGIESDFHIIDDGLAKLAASPASFDVVVTTNMFGDIGSDIAAQVTGGIGFVSSNNIGKISMFETMGGTADDIALGSQKSPGGNLANPVALIDGAAEMLIHIGGHANLQAGEMIKAATLTVLQKGYYTNDVKAGLYQQDKAKQLGMDVASMKLGTKEFANKIIEEIGRLQSKLKASPNASVKDLMDDGALKSRMRSYSVALSMQTAGGKEWNDRLKRCVPVHTPANKYIIRGADFFIEETGMELKRLADGGLDRKACHLKTAISEKFTKKTGIKIEDMLSAGQFNSIQEIRTFAEYFAESLNEFLLSPVGQKATGQNLAEVLKSLGIPDEITERFSESLLEQKAAPAVQKLQEFVRNSRELVKCLYSYIAAKAKVVGDAHGFELLRITNRGTEVYPTIGDLDIRTIHRLRYGLKAEAAANSGKPQELSSALYQDLLKEGFLIAQWLLNRDFYDTEGPNAGQQQKGLSKAYGTGLGEKYE